MHSWQHVGARISHQGTHRYQIGPSGHYGAWTLAHTSEAEALKAHPYFVELVQEIAARARPLTLGEAEYDHDGLDDDVYNDIQEIVFCKDYLTDEKIPSSPYGVIQTREPCRYWDSDFEVQVSSLHPTKDIPLVDLRFEFTDKKTATAFHERMVANKAGEMKGLWQIFTTQSEDADKMFASVEQLLGKTWVGLCSTGARLARDVKSKLEWARIPAVDWRETANSPDLFKADHFCFLSAG